MQVVKIYLHVSGGARQRLLDRINEPDKHWKFSSGDVRERKHWEDYMAAYEMMSHTSTEYAPWYCVPADNKWFARYLISEIIKEQLEAIDPRHPELSREQAVLEECRGILENGG